MKNEVTWKRAFSWFIPLAVGGLAFLLSGGMDSYKVINQPPLSPPGWLFPIVWTILYVLMGEAAYRIYISDAEPKQKKKALIAYGIQLAINLLWPIIFFGAQQYLVAFVVLVVLWIAIFITLRWFTLIEEKTGDLLIPYFLWVTFAAYLNFGVFLLN